MLDLSTLNGPQREAVECVEGPLLVLAGAGSGKTRVLTYRIANLIDNHGVRPWQILALTFTNKAAAEMRERTEKLTGISAKDMWVMTFHSFCSRVLRFDIDRLGYTSQFTIYDDNDQSTVIAEIMKRIGVDDKQMPKSYIRSVISEAKNATEAPEQYISEVGDPGGKLRPQPYGAHREQPVGYDRGKGQACRRAGVAAAGLNEKPARRDPLGLRQVDLAAALEHVYVSAEIRHGMRLHCSLQKKFCVMRFAF